MNDIRWTRGGRRRGWGGEGSNCQNNALDHPFEHSNAVLTPDLSVIEAVRLDQYETCFQV